MLAGILPVLPTPFTRSGAIDLAAMAAVTDFAIAANVDGVVFPGFASEVDELSGPERASLLKVVVGQVRGRIPVVAGTSAPSAELAIEYAGEALAEGVSAFMIQTPRSIGAAADAVAAFYQTIADALPGCQIVLQNAPAPRGSDLKPRTILEIVRDNPAITYVKEETLPSGPAISALLAGRPVNLKGVIGGGGARYFVDEYNRGACGAMPAVELADVHVAMDRAFRAGDVAGARELYMRTLPLLVIQANFRMAFTKHVLCRRGILDNRVVRAATPSMDAHDIAEIDAWLDACADLMPSAKTPRPLVAGLRG